MKKKGISYVVFMLELLQTDALITPVKTIFYITFLSTLSDISLYKLILVGFVFLLEIPSGYFSDRYGNKIVVASSYLLTIISFALMIISPNNFVFIISNAIIGVSNALLSGAKNTYLLVLCKDAQIDYKSIKISASAYKKIFELLLMSISGICFTLNIYTPFIITMLIYLILLTFVILQKSDRNIIDNKTEKNSNENILEVSKKLTKKILMDREIMNELIFYTITTTLLISNFDFYNIHFKNLGIDEKYFGLIYAAFMIINFIGIKLYSKKISIKIENIFFILIPITFVTILLDNYMTLGLSIIVQQLMFSYLFIHFEIYVIDSIEEIKTSSHYQSLISFFNSLFRILILSVITIVLKVIQIDQLYVFFALFSLCVCLVYISLRKNEQVNCEAKDEV